MWWCFCGCFFCGGVFVVVWWCFCGGAVVFFLWCFCGGVLGVVFL